jgi:hypothetical protein
LKDSSWSKAIYEKSITTGRQRSFGNDRKMRIVFLSLVGLSLLGSVQRSVADPVHLVCRGKSYFHTDPQQAQAIEDTVSLTIEWDYAGSTSSDQIGRARVGPVEAALMAKPSENTVTIIGDTQAKSRLRIGTLDRLTGQLYLDFGILADSPRSFIGTCRPGKKVF